MSIRHGDEQSQIQQKTHKFSCLCSYYIWKYQEAPTVSFGKTHLRKLLRKAKKRHVIDLLHQIYLENHLHQNQNHHRNNKIHYQEANLNLVKKIDLLNAVIFENKNIN